MPKERSGGPRLDQSCDWEKYGYDNTEHSTKCVRFSSTRQVKHCKLQ